MITNPKRPTIAALTEEISKLQAQVGNLNGACVNLRARVNEETELKEKLGRELRQMKDLHASEMSTERHLRVQAEIAHDRQRQTTMLYFMAQANPATSSDAARLAALQEQLTGITPPRGNGNDNGAGCSELSLRDLGRSRY